MANTPSWVGKLPRDMNDAELREAKDAVFEQLGPAQERLNWLAAAGSNLDAEVNNRFHMSAVAVTMVPDYPADAVSQEFGSAS